jgi:D-3-phosphoglycerate dehydrogenase
MKEDVWEILLPEQIDPSGPDSIIDIASFTSVSEFGLEPSDLEPHIHKFDAIILRNAKLTSAVLANAENLKIIAKHGVGLDNVDIDAATRNNVVVCNTPGANSRAVAEHALTLLFAVNRQVVAVDSATRTGDWNRQRWVSNELGGRTLGLFGCGHIGRTLATIADNLDLTVLGYDPYLAQEDLPDVITKVTKDDLFERSDAVSIHSPLTEETRGAVSTPELERLSSDGILINTARGEIVDEDALVEAVRENTIFGAGIDVFSNEPPASDNPLFDHQNVIMSQHIGGVTREALQRMSEGAAGHLRTRYEGKVPETTVNTVRTR